MSYQKGNGRLFRKTGNGMLEEFADQSTDVPSAGAKWRRPRDPLPEKLVDISDREGYEMEQETIWNA